MTNREKLDLIYEFITAYLESDFPNDAEELAYINGTIDCILNVIGFGRRSTDAEEE